jgi:hypothetical protein
VWCTAAVISCGGDDVSIGESDSASDTSASSSTGVDPTDAVDATSGADDTDEGSEVGSSDDGSSGTTTGGELGCAEPVELPWISVSGGPGIAYESSISAIECTIASQRGRVSTLDCAGTFEADGKTSEWSGPVMLEVPPELAIELGPEPLRITETYSYEDPNPRWTKTISQAQQILWTWQDAASLEVAKDVVKGVDEAACPEIVSEATGSCSRRHGLRVQSSAGDESIVIDGTMADVGDGEAIVVASYLRFDVYDCGATRPAPYGYPKRYLVAYPKAR